MTPIFLLTATVAAGVIALAKPRVAVAGVLVLAYLTPAPGIRVAFGGVRTDPVELAAFALFGFLALRLATQRDRVPNPLPMAAPLVALVGAVVIAGMYAVLQGADRSTVIGPAKPLLLYALPLALVVVLPRREDRDWLERVVIAVSAIGSVMTLLGSAFGRAVTSEAAAEVVTLGQTAAAQRLRPGVLSLVFLATLLVVNRMLARGPASSDWGLLGLFAVVQLYSFNRSTWVSLGAALLLYALRRPGERRPLRGIKATLTSASAVVVFVIVASTGILGPTAMAISARARSVVDPEVFEERSYELRQDEEDIAWRTIRERPVLGVGLGQPYGKVARVASPFGGRQTVDVLILHNSVLKAWLWLGVPGLLAFVALGVTVARHVRRLRLLDHPEAARALAAAAALAGFALRSTFQTSLLSRSAILAVGCAVALVAVPLARADSDDESRDDRALELSA